LIGRRGGELSQPFTGVFRAPSAAFDQMLASIGR
jgi:hypothetical protein